MPLHLLQIAKKLAHDAGKMALEYQKKGFKVDTKGSHVNLVTEADKACNELIVSVIQKNFPDHSIISEEIPPIKGTSDYKWIIDPIDGTTNFAQGLPIFSISIAVIHKGVPIIGVVEVPGTGETFWAKQGEGAYLGKHRIHVSQTSELKNGLYATGLPYERGSARTEKTFKIYQAINTQSRGVRRIGTSAGRYDGYFEYDLEAWDIAAGKIIVEEAGGMVTNMDGSMLSPKKGTLLASNGLLHSKLMETIKKEGGLNV